MMLAGYKKIIFHLHRLDFQHYSVQLRVANAADLLLCLCILCLSLWQQVWPPASRWRSCERCLSGSPCSTSVTMASSKRSDTLPLWWASSTQIAIFNFHLMYRVWCQTYFLVIYHLCSAAWSFDATVRLLTRVPDLNQICCHPSYLAAVAIGTRMVQMVALLFDKKPSPHLIYHPFRGLGRFVSQLLMLS